MFTINAQALRGFMFIPALGWREVEPSTLIPARFKHFNPKADINTNTVYNEDGLIAVYTLIYANRNRKDIHRVQRTLNDVLKRAFEDIKH